MLLLDRVFTSAFEAECFHRSLGQDGWRIIQTSPGEFSYRLEIIATEQVTTYRCSLGVELLMQGEGVGDDVFFCFVDRSSVDHGVSNAPTDVYGMHTTNKDVFHLMQPGVMMAHSVSRPFFEKITASLEAINPGQGEQLNQLLTGSMKFQLLPLDMQMLHKATSERLARPDLVDEAKTEQFVLLLAQLAVRSENPLSLRAVPERNRSIADLVRHQFDSNCFKKLKVQDLAGEFGYSDRSLQLASSDSMNRGPMETLTLVRLEQARRALTHQSCQEAWTAETGMKPTCGNVFKWYDLGSKGGSLYRGLFGVTPKQDQMDSRKKVVVT